MHTIQLSPEQVGLSFQAQLETTLISPSRKRRGATFRRLNKVLRDLGLIPKSTEFSPEYITIGVDSNGDGIILVRGKSLLTVPSI